MSKALRVPDYLQHILQAIERIDRNTADLDEIGFFYSELVQDAVIRNIEIVWKTIQGDLPGLHAQVQEAFAELFRSDEKHAQEP